MYHFAIVDDNHLDLEMIHEALKDHCDYHSIIYNIDLYSDALSFNFNKNYDAVFLDIEMPNINGIELAQKINDAQPTKIIFITNYEEYINVVFSVSPFHFIRKSNLKFETIKVLNLLFKKLKKERFKIKTSKDTLLLTNNDVIYIAKENDLTILYTKDNHYIIWDSITSLYNQLKRFDIEKINQSTLINLQHIKELKDRNVILNNNKEFPISTRLYKSFYKIYEDYLINNL